MHPNAPFVKRQGEVNAWDNEEFRKAVEATGRKQVIIAGITTDVSFCVVMNTGVLQTDIESEYRYASHSLRSHFAMLVILYGITQTRAVRNVFTCENAMYSMRSRHLRCSYRERCK